MKYTDIWGDELELTFVKGHYVSDGLALVATCEGEEYAVVTVWLVPLRTDHMAYLDTNNCPDIVQAMVDNGYCMLTGATRASGFCEYPLALFDKEWLESLEEMK